MIKKVIGAMVGTALIGTGLGINQATGLGNDTIGIFYDGIRVLLKVSIENYGTLITIINIVLVALLFIVGRKHIHIGTLIYMLLYGKFAEAGGWIYAQLPLTDSLAGRSVIGFMGCAILYFGIALFIVSDIGVDPVTGLAASIAEKAGWQFKTGRRCIDFTLMAAGILAGGTFGVITLATVVAAGPVIQFFTECLQKLDYVIKKPEISAENGHKLNCKGSTF